MKLFACSRYALIVALVCAGLVGCEKKGKPRIEVSAFITTQGGESVKLGNVEIITVPRKFILEAAARINQPAVAISVAKKKIIDAKICLHSRICG